jgi:Beta-xylosidase
MKHTKNNYLLALILLITTCNCTSIVSDSKAEKIIRNGIPWYDNNGNIVNAHGACIVEDGGRYYLFGEWKSDESNAFPGFSCYSSDDLVNWKFENVVLPVQKDGILGPDRVGERVKVMKCPMTGEYVMYMHADDMGYYDPYIGYATCKTIAGDYEFHGPLLFDGEPIRRWDMGTFQDTDGKGYLLIHHGIIYRLSDNYRSAEAKILDRLPGSGESPAMFKKDGLYYMLYSGLTSWEKNDNFYFTAPNIEGPWEAQGLFVQEGKLTYNSQTTFVFPLVRGKDTIPMFMGDRWSYPHQASAATYVWLPLQVEGKKISIPEFWECWDIETIKPMEPLKRSISIDAEKIKFNTEDNWIKNNNRMISNIKGSTVEIPFRGRRVAIKGETNNKSGYARVTIRDNRGETMYYSSLVDFYTKYTTTGTRYLSPVLPEGNYTLIVEVTGISPVWTDKSKARYGSTDCYVTIMDVVNFK